MAFAILRHLKRIRNLCVVLLVLASAAFAGEAQFVDLDLAKKKVSAWPRKAVSSLEQGENANHIKFRFVPPQSSEKLRRGEVGFGIPLKPPRAVLRMAFEVKSNVDTRIRIRIQDSEGATHSWQDMAGSTTWERREVVLRDSPDTHTDPVQPLKQIVILAATSPFDLAEHLFEIRNLELFAE